MHSDHMLSRIVKRTDTPADVYVDSIPHYGGMILSRKEDPAEMQTQVVDLVYVRLYRGDEIPLAIKVLERIHQLTVNGQGNLLEVIKSFDANPHIYISWAEFVTCTPEVGDNIPKVKAEHSNVEQLQKAMEADRDAEKDTEHTVQPPSD